MSTANIAYLEGRTDADFEGFNHLTYFRPSLLAVAGVGRYVADLAGEAEASAAAAAASYASQVNLGAGVYGIGLGGQLHLPRVANLGTAAFGDFDVEHNIYVNEQTSAYQITPHDRNKLLLVPSGTVTLTLPLGTDVPAGWSCRWMNISTNNLTFARSGSDTINAGATSKVIASADYIGHVVRRSSTTWLIG